MNKDIKIDGLKKETFLLDEQEKIVLKEEVNIDSHIKHNKALYNHNDGYSKSKLKGLLNTNFSFASMGK